VGVLTECLTEKVFICDYHSAYPVGEDLDAVSQVCPEMYPLYRMIEILYDTEMKVLRQYQFISKNICKKGLKIRPFLLQLER
jgi:hypothetical protein